MPIFEIFHFSWAPLTAVPMFGNCHFLLAPLAAVPMYSNLFNFLFKTFPIGEKILKFHAKFSEKGNFAVLAEIESVFLIRPPF